MMTMEEHRVEGRKEGYPECCIDYFCEFNEGRDRTDPGSPGAFESMVGRFGFRYPDDLGPFGYISRAPCYDCARGLVARWRAIMAAAA